MYPAYLAMVFQSVILSTNVPHRSIVPTLEFDRPALGGKRPHRSDVMEACQPHNMISKRSVVLA